MPKNIDDIVPRERRSIRDIPIPNGRRKTDARSPAAGSDIRPLTRTVSVDPIAKPAPTLKREESADLPPPPRMRVPIERQGGKKGRWIAAVVAVLILVFAVLSLMRSSSLAYTPRTAALSFANDEVNAFKSGGTDVLLFSVVKLSDDASQSVSASGPAVNVSKKASGTLIVYNNASAAPQKLVATTRFQSSDGHIYRTPAAITIPGKTSAGPGSLEVKVVADEPGADYNIGLEDFTIPGFKGDPKYQTVYARSKTPMSGGFVGSEKAVSDSDRTNAVTALKNKLATELQDEAKAQVPADFVLFPNLSVVTYTDEADSSSTDSSVTLNEHADYAGVMIKRSDLANYLGMLKLSLPAGQAIDIPDLDSLQVSFSGTPPTDLIDTTEVSLSFSGSTTAVWQTDKTALAASLAGHSKSDVPSILKNYPGIDSATAIIRPFWKSSFPSDPAQITIKENSWK